MPDAELIRSHVLCFSSSHLSIFSSKTFSTLCRRGTCFLLYLQLFQSADLRLSNAFNGVHGCVCTINLNLSPSTVFFFGKKEFYDSLEFIGFSIPFARKTGSFQLQWVVVYPITGNNRIPVFQKTKTHQCACARSTIKIRFATVSASRNGEFSRLWELLEADREKKLWGIPH